LQVAFVAFSGIMLGYWPMMFDAVRTLLPGVAIAHFASRLRMPDARLLICLAITLLATRLRRLTLIPFVMMAMTVRHE